MESTENRYKYIFDEILTLTDDGFVVVDTNGVITDINDQYCKYLMSFTVRNTKIAATASVPLIKSSATAAVLQR